MDCHSKRDYSKFSGPLTEGTLGIGGDRFDQTLGMPGVLFARNITPAGISRYTDGELFRVITTGVTEEGRAMFPLMPYPYYSRMDTEDIYSIIAYVRSIPAIKNEVADFSMNFILNTIPKKTSPQKRPEKSDRLAYGAYMTNASGCIECHTQMGKRQIIPNLLLVVAVSLCFQMVQPFAPPILHPMPMQELESGRRKHLFRDSKPMPIQLIFQQI